MLKIKKKLKTRSIKTKKPLVNNQTVKKQEFIDQRKWVSPVFTETMPEVEKRKTN